MSSKRNIPDSKADQWVGEHIKMLRTQASMTQLQLGRKVNIFLQQVERYEKGARIPVTLMEALAEALDTPIPKRVIRKIVNTRKLEVETKTTRDDELLELYKEAFAE